jgi:hypothetical protein
MGTYLRLTPYRGRSYFTGINTSSTNSQYHDFMRIGKIIKIYSILTELVLIAYQKTSSGVGIFGSFEISTTGINACGIRAPPVYYFLPQGCTP